ncbi:hypothetical protein KKE14_03095 [Patescibacteria group bacterium]|nr:hypothetical protein [Patescibacteria group bacterium]
MIKPIQKLKRATLRLFEEELMALLALSIVAISMFFVQAQTSAQTNLSFTICPADDNITVIIPNGGERWKVGEGQNITWTTCDPDSSIINVKIELQRSTGGAWETIVASTSNDGVYGWPVTEPVTTTALVRVSNADDLAVDDSSNAVFEIYKGGGGRPNCPVVTIDNVTPNIFSSDEDVTLIITGYFSFGDVQVYLDDELLFSEYISDEEVNAIVPAGFPVGDYVLRVMNYCGNYDEYEVKVITHEVECNNPVINEVTPQTFANTQEVLLTIKGFFEYGDEKVFLGGELLDHDYISNKEMEAIVPAGFPPGSYNLTITNGCGGYAKYNVKIIVYEEEEDEEEEEIEPIIDIIVKPILDLMKPFIRPPSTGGIAKPKPSHIFVPESKFYTDKFEQNWICYLIWLIIILLFGLLLKEYFSEDDPKKKKRKVSINPMLR